MSGIKNKILNTPLPIWVGAGLTIFILWVVVCIGKVEICIEEVGCGARWRLLLVQAPANELGDTFSGIAGALAFIWLVMTAWMQSMELREQRKELQAQREEWEKISAAQDAQVKILEKQSEIFEEEKQQRHYAQQNAVLDERLNGVVYAIDRNKEKLIYRYQTINPPADVCSGEEIGKLSNSLKYKSLNEILLHFHSEVRGAINIFCNPKIKILYKHQHAKERLFFAINEILAHYQLVIPLSAHVSPDQKARLQNIQAEETIKFLEELHEKLSKP